MKLFTCFAILSAALCKNVVFGAGASSFNGVNPGRSYKDIKNHNPVVSHRYSADPGVMVYDGRVYIYGSNDGNVSERQGKTNDYSQIKTITLLSSSDLVNWMDHGPIPATGQNGAARFANNSWAPAACHKKINGKEKFFVYFANNASGICVLESDSPTGPFKDPLGKPLITRQTPNSNVEWLFDPACLVDDDGNGYLYFGGGVPNGQGANPKTVRVVKLGNDMKSLAGTPQTIDAPWVFEDSGINKIGNTYFYNYCTNFNGGPYGNGRIAYMTSNSPMGPFTYKGTCFNNQGDYLQDGGGNNHHTIIEFKNKYYIFYHAQWLDKQVKGKSNGYRTTHVDELPMNGNSFGNAKATVQGVQQLGNVDGSKLNYAASMAWQSGIDVQGHGAVTQVKYNRGAWTGVSNVDLGGASSITLKASSKSGATIKVCTDSEKGNAFGYVEIPAGGSLQEVKGTLSGATGTKNLFFVSSGDAVIESWQLGGSSSSSSNTGNSSAGNSGSSSNSSNSSGCWSKSIGYSCCKNCGKVYYIDKDGEWGIENGNWCGMPTNCKSYKQIAKNCKGAQGYSCCAFACDTLETDKDGNWSIENNQWCLINKQIC